MKNTTCVIIGDRMIGLVMALELLRKSEASLKIIVVETQAEMNPDHLMENPVQQLSLEPGDNLDFSNWLKRSYGEGGSLADWPFVSRRLFSEYLLGKVRSNSVNRLEVIQASVLARTPYVSSHTVSLAGGRVLEADFVILTAKSGKNRESLQGRSENVSHELIVGLTPETIQYWKSSSREASRKFTFLTEHGPLLLAELKSPTIVRLPQFKGMSPLQILQVLTRMVDAGGVKWQDLADSVRRQAQSIWSCWTSREKQRFLRHLLPYWRAISSRVPSSLIERLKSEVGSKNVTLIAGHFIKTTPGIYGQVDVIFRTLDDEKFNKQTFDRVYLPADRSMSQSLSPGEATQGVARLWLVGPASQAIYWEVTRVADIIWQCRNVADEVVGTSQPYPNTLAWKFLAHPSFSQETYLQHFFVALGFSISLFKLAFVALTHAVFPFLFMETVSEWLRNLSPAINRRRAKSFSVASPKTKEATVKAQLLNAA